MRKRAMTSAAGRTRAGYSRVLDLPPHSTVAMWYTSWPVSAIFPATIGSWQPRGRTTASSGTIKLTGTAWASGVGTTRSSFRRSGIQTARARVHGALTSPLMSETDRASGLWRDRCLWCARPPAQTKTTFFGLNHSREPPF